jgi:hypothetical protein
MCKNKINELMMFKRLNNIITIRLIMLLLILNIIILSIIIYLMIRIYKILIIIVCKKIRMRILIMLMIRILINVKGTLIFSFFSFMLISDQVGYNQRYYLFA